MQLTSHVAIAYIVYKLVFKDSNEYLIPFLIATVFIDLDHIFVLKANKEKLKSLKPMGALSRTRLHELYGLVFFSTIFLLLYFVDSLLAKVLSLGLILHYILDFLTGETRPFYPYSDEKIQIFFTKNRKGRIILEVILFLSLAIFLLCKYYGKC